MSHIKKQIRSSHKPISMKDQRTLGQDMIPPANEWIGADDDVDDWIDDR